MSEGFFDRWSRRKQGARAGRPVDEAPVDGVRSEPAAELPAQVRTELHPAHPEGPQDAPPPPTLDDARQLTPDADFTPFMAREVAPEVKNAALKQLFTDPRFNVMDGLDVYIDDYSKPDPLPPALLRQLAGARALGLFDGDPQQPDVPTVVENAPSDPAAAPALAHSQDDHADPDLRLQQDHAVGAPGTGRGAA